jgi:hypothetical protein
MTENNFRNSNRHHGRRNRHTPRDMHSEDVNTHVSEPTPRVGKRIHHKKEENPHKERTTKMSKRATRIISSAAASIALIFTLTANSFGFESRTPRPRDNRADARPEVSNSAFEFDKSGAVFSREAFRTGTRAVSDFERARGDVFALRAENRSSSRALETFSFRVRQKEFNSRPNARTNFASRPADAERPDERFDDRRDYERGESLFRAERLLRLGNDIDSIESRTDRDKA